jgi:hypothetical protein
MVSTGDDNVVDESIHTMKKNTRALLLTSKKNGLEINADKMKCMFMSLEQNAGQNYNLQTDNPLKVWNSSSIWEQPRQNKFVFRKKLGVD